MKKILWALLLATLIAVPAYAYVIQPGDTVSDLSVEYDIPIDDIVERNNIEDPNWIYVGDYLDLDEMTFGTAIARPEMFFETSLSRGLSLGGSETEIYVATLPTESSGYVVINPYSSSNRELIYYGDTTSTGGNQLIQAARGLAFSFDSELPSNDTSSTLRAKRHSAGESVVLSNGRYEQIVMDVLNGLRGVDGPMYYNTASSLTSASSSILIHKSYADNLAISGGSTSTESVFGFVGLGTQIEMASSTFDEDQPTVLYTKYSTSTPLVDGLYIPVSLNNGYLHQNWFDQAYDWTQTGDWIFNSAVTLVTTTAPTIGEGTVSTTANIYGVPQADGNNEISEAWLPDVYNNLIFASSSSQITIRANTTQVIIASTTISANTFAVGDVVNFELNISDFDFIGNNSQFATATLEFGATTVAEVVLPATNYLTALTNGYGSISGSMYSTGANTQKAVIKMETTSSTLSVGGMGTGTGAENVAVDKSLVLKWKFSNSDAAYGIVIEDAKFNILKQ